MITFLAILVTGVVLLGPFLLYLHHVTCNKE